MSCVDDDVTSVDDDVSSVDDDMSSMEDDVSSLLHDIYNCVILGAIILATAIVVAPVHRHHLPRLIMSSFGLIVS